MSESGERPAWLSEDRLRRKALVYVRQSSPKQVRDNTGSAEVQRKLRDVLIDWGYPPESVEVVYDLGVTGSIPGVRLGFDDVLERLQSGPYGLVAATGIDRVGRNNLDFARFARVCQERNILLYQAGRAIDFRHPVDEFIGMLIEQTHVFTNKTRIEHARASKRKKAEAGKVVTTPPVGMQVGPDGRLKPDEDPQIRRPFELLFGKFFELGSATRLTRFMHTNGINLPGRRLPNGQRRWVKPTVSRVVAILRNPAYAGVYEYGKTTVSEEVDAKGRKRSVRQPVTEWVRKEDHTGYVDKQTRAEIQQRLTANRLTANSPLGKGPALVQGRVRCAHHQGMVVINPYRRRMADGTVRRLPAYRCDVHPDSGRAAFCCTIPARLVDHVVERQLLEVLNAPSLDDIHQEIHADAASYETQVKLREEELRRSEQRAVEKTRAAEQFAEGHPLLARRLADEAEEALRQVDSITTHHLRHPLVPPEPLDETELDELMTLAE